MIATAQAKVIAITEQHGKDKLDSDREFTFYKVDLMTNEGVIIFTTGKDFSTTVDKDCNVMFNVEGKNKVILVDIQPIDVE